MKYLIFLSAALILTSVTVQAQQNDPPTVASMRDTAPLAEPAPAPEMARTEDSAERRVRSYPEQPPTIPHDIDGYQVTLKANKCLSCHARNRVEESGAPMVSITHFMDREGQFLAAVSPRRYFCNQCHIAQQAVDPPVENTFVDVDHVIGNMPQQ